LIELKKPNLFITITRKNKAVLSKEWISSIRKAFTKITRRVYYKRHLTGGIYGIECVEKGNGWNLHLHAVGSGVYFSSSRLSTDLMEITGDSFISDVGIIQSPDDSFRYIIRDLTKAPPLNGKSEEYDKAFKRFRFVSKFGDWYAYPNKDPHVAICPHCGGTDLMSEFFIDQQIRKMHETN